MNIYIASDHAGFKLKEGIKKYYSTRSINIIDLGPKKEVRTSYALSGLNLANTVLKNNGFGIGICGTGIGISMSVNRVNGIRGARICSVEDAKLAKLHNNANIILFGARQISLEEAIAMIEEFEKTEFEGGRHSERLGQLDE